MSAKPEKGQLETVQHLLDRSGRKPPMAVPIRRSFVQQGPQGQPEPGPLSQIVRNRDVLALNLFLLHRALASSEPWDVTRASPVWARTVGHSLDADAGRAAISKAWRRLDRNYGLVSRGRRGRLASVTALDESGKRAPYSAPLKDYFKLPFTYWTGQWFITLGLPGKATLLIALSLKPGFYLPAERAPDWYGISSDTVGRGLQELLKNGLLTRKSTKVQDWGSPTGERAENRYTLLSPFAKMPAKGRSATN